MRKLRKNPLEVGSVIRTNPEPGFWGCAVVLSAYDESPEFWPSSHIAITDFLRRHRYSVEELQASSLVVLQYSAHIRTAPYKYATTDPRTRIGIYTVGPTVDLDIISKIETKNLYAYPLTLEVGDGTEGTFPLCGPVPNDLGREAVVAWRRIHDSARFAEEQQARADSFEEYERLRLENQRKTRSN